MNLTEITEVLEMDAETPISFQLSLSGKLEAACSPLIGGPHTAVLVAREKLEPGEPESDIPTVVILLRTPEGQVVAAQVPALCFLQAAMDFQDHLRSHFQIERHEPCEPSTN